MKENNPLVKLENAGVYKSSKWLVKGISFEVNNGQIVTLIGPNGSGKTTTAKMILNILNADEGLVTSNTNKMAYVPQKINIDWTMPLRVVDFMKLTSSLNNIDIIERNYSLFPTRNQWNCNCHVVHDNDLDAEPSFLALQSI